MNTYLCLVIGIILLSFIYVSGIKNKTGLPRRNFSSEAVQSSSVTQSENIHKVNINNEFLHWFSGFTDAEGNFYINWS